MKKFEGIAKPIDKTSSSERIDNGPYIGIVKGYGDDTGKNRIAVYIPALQTTRLSSETGPSKQEKAENVILCNMMLPYYGRTNRTGNNKESYDGTSKSYGMVFPTPDIDTQVVVMFTDGRKHNGLIIGSVPDPFNTHMVPGIAASPSFHETDDTKCANFVPTQNRVPVAEFNRQALDSREDWLNIPRPVHPLFNTFLQQGLADDMERGPTTASMTRESPSNVFGFSTPGPLDIDGPKITQGLVSTGTKDGYEAYDFPSSRGTGHTFVMDDGAASGGSRHVRMRSGTGHQILLNDSEGIIYIANNTGTAWMEFTEEGRIEFFGAHDFSIHTEGNMHFLADKNINIQSGEDINIMAGHNMRVETNPESLEDKGNVHYSINGDLKMYTSGTMNFRCDDLFNVTAKETISMTSKDCMLMRAKEIHLNGPNGNQAELAAKVPQWASPYVEFNEERCTWEVSADFQYISATPRVPTHEPDSRLREESTDDLGPPEHIQAL